MRSLVLSPRFVNREMKKKILLESKSKLDIRAWGGYDYSRC